MKNKNTCPKCGSKDILFIPGEVGLYGTGNNIMTGMTLLSGVPVNRYICGDCGFTEEWVNLEDLPKIKKKYD